jgi:uncharacterized membrane protein YbhN (UPF0104 family)
VKLPNARKLLSYLFFAAGIGAAVWVIASRRDELTAAVQRMNLIAIAGSFGCGMLAVLALFGSWLAAVTDGGVSLPVRAGLQIYGVGQIGKYLPGSVWPVLTQTQLGRRRGISPLRMASGALLALAVSVDVGLVMGGLFLPFSGHRAVRVFWWVPLVAIPMVLVLIPAVLNRLISVAARVLRRGEVASGYSWAGIGRSAAWAALGNLLFGLHIYLLGIGLGETSVRGFVLAVCAYSLASSVGVIVIFAPAGAGAREAVLVAVLAPVLSVDAALAIALVSRVLLIAVDVLIATSQLRGLNRWKTMPPSYPAPMS